jgi:8-oxo-dGTP pyrophosphatase MutT (NUDIX family)
MTPNDRFLALLDAHQPADAKEIADIALIRRMAARIDNLMDQRQREGHITGGALVMDAHSGRFLLHFHKKLNRWLQFGGHAEVSEPDPSHTALRESCEESGLSDLRFLVAHPVDIDVHSIPARGDQPEHLHLDFRYVLLTNTPHQVSVPADESPHFRWLATDDLRTADIHIDPALRRLIAKAVALFDGSQAEAGKKVNP